MKSVMFVLGVAAASCAAACSSSPTEHEKKLQAALDTAQVSLKGSVGIAEAETESVAVTARLLVDADPVFSVGAHASSAFQDVRVDIVTGKVLSLQVGKSTDTCPGSVSVGESIAAAEAELGGQAVAVAWDDDGQCNREVQVMTGGTLYEAKVAPNGTVIETEESDDDGAED